MKCKGIEAIKKFDKCKVGISPSGLKYKKIESRMNYIDKRDDEWHISSAPLADFFETEFEFEDGLDDNKLKTALKECGFTQTKDVSWYKCIDNEISLGQLKNIIEAYEKLKQAEK